MIENKLEQKTAENISGLETTLKYNPESAKKTYGLKEYFVDTSALWIYWTPVLAVTEAISGMEQEEIIKSRLMGLALHTFIGTPQRMFRQYLADLWEANDKSSRAKKTILNITATVCFQAPLYSAMVYFSGVSLKEGILALATGLPVGVLSGVPLGYVQDKWRKLWGLKPVLD